MGTTAKDPLDSQSVQGIDCNVSEEGYTHYRTDDQSISLTPENHDEDLLDIGNVDIFFNDIQFYQHSVHLRRNGDTSAVVGYDDLDDRILYLLRSY